MNNLELIARYAFPPNSKKYCGPEDSSSRILELIQGKASDKEYFESAFAKFEAMFPHLQLIAQANDKKPLDLEIAQAYWEGSELLENVKIEDWKKTGELLAKNAKWDEALAKKYVSKINSDFSPHHSFHVLSSYTLTLKEPEIALEKINQCLISWGKVLSAENNALTVVKRPVVLNFGKFSLGTPEVAQAQNPKIVECEKGDFVSMHWSFACKKLELEELKNLEKYTLQNLRNFNAGFS